MTILCAKEIEDAAKLSPEQIAALKHASMKKRFQTWNSKLISIEFFAAICLAVLSLVFVATESRSVAAVFIFGTACCAIAGALQVYTYLLALKVYDPEEIKTALVE